MRTQLQDTNRIFQVTTLSPVAASGDSSGAFSDGTPWRAVRAGTGLYDIYHDPRLSLISAKGVDEEQARQYYHWVTTAPGTFRIRVLFQDSSLVDAVFDLICNFLDNRT